MRLSAIIGGLVLFICVSRIYGAAIDTCPDEVVVTKARPLLDSNPIKVVELLREAPNCDEKFALLYLADGKIAHKARSDFYYNDKIYPRGWYDQEPTPYELQVIENPQRFKSASEGRDWISPSEYWVRQIKDAQHPIIGVFELSTIQDLDRAVWEDGDGRMHSSQLIARYEEWIRRFPQHPAEPTVRARIKELFQTNPDEAEAAFRAGDYELALQLARPLAGRGDAKAQTIMGKLHYLGKAVRFSNEMAIEWWSLASEQGFPEAQFWLAHMYTAGHGVATDEQKAIRLLREAAKKNYAPAQDSLGRKYYKSDSKKALQYLRKAAAQDYAPSQHFLGTMYRDGIGVDQDYSMAYAWIRKAAEQNNLWAQLDLGVLYMEGKGAAQDDIEAYKWIFLAMTQDHEIDGQIAMDAESLIVVKLSRRMNAEQMNEAKRRAAAFLRRR